MKVLLTGATGFIGSKLIHSLVERGHEVVAPVRNLERARKKLPREVSCVLWPDAEAPLPRDAALGVDAVIHLLGESIADGRWTVSRKQQLRDSRIKSTERLFECFEQAKLAPKVYVSASAIGYYGDRGDEELTEQSSPSADFLARLTVEWEKAAHQFSKLGSRVVCVRTGIVLGPTGGALEKMLPLFRLGLGGKLGSGKQWFSWIHIDDLINIYIRSLEDDMVQGAINAVAPNPVRNMDLTHTLGSELHRPAFLQVPSFALRLALGELSASLLGGAKVFPSYLTKNGFQFLHPQLKEALKDIISRHP